MINRLKIKIIGKNPDYFLKEIIKRNINFYNLEKTYNSITIIVNYNDYLKLLDIKTTYKIKIVNFYGLSKLKVLIKRYLYLIIFSLIGLFIIIFLSNLIFKIEVIHPNKEVVNLVEKDLKELGLKKYNLKPSYKKIQDIKEKILSKEKDKIEWLEIENIGTKYIIKLERRKINNNGNKCIERNIISNKDAIILEIQSSTGEISKKINDYVTKGEILISGFIHNKETVVSKKCAEGIVYGETWYKVIVSIPKEYKKEKILNNKNHGVNIKVFNNDIDLHKKMSNFKRNNNSILSSKIIPIELNYTEYQEIKITNIIYNLNNVDSKALSIVDNRINKNLKEEECILSKKVLKKTIKNSKIEVEVFIKVKENITTYQDISKIDIEEMNKKEE